MQRPTEGSPMIKKLQKHGNSRALVIDKALLDALNIGEDDEVEVAVMGNTLVVQPAHVGLGRERVSELMSRVRSGYGQALKNLAE